MAPASWEESDDEAVEGESLFEEFFDDPFDDLDDEYDDEDEEEHPLSTRHSRRQRDYRRDS